MIRNKQTDKKKAYGAYVPKEKKIQKKKSKQPFVDSTNSFR